ncbi:glycosyltransferase family 4 protein [Starkeya sp. ORNL1]|uniref:glycosyltransferase n=1 Tax=Starkeya sp. ORNL1 TaxID=2709380 RepID=UPI001462A700|nr:glycosyltransferase [Starkeya sp. ORNL1]QJP14821.1 glycosyltransferase family 4 protein [Starkeya sp. ORNL1]
MLNADVLTDLSRPDDVLAMLRGAKIMVNTSDAEGFPNATLEAWTVGVPVLPLTVDPGGVFERHGLGLLSSAEAQLAHDLGTLGGDAMNREAGTRALVHVAPHHGLAVILDSLLAAADAPRRRAPHGTYGRPREVAP